MLCEQMGFETGIDMRGSAARGRLISEMLGAPQGGRAHYWLSRNAAA
jgi:hydroxymethylglutaryl-CoA lyase